MLIFISVAFKFFSLVTTKRIQVTATPAEVDEPDDPELEPSPSAVAPSASVDGGGGGDIRDVLVNGLLGYCFTDLHRFGVTAIYTSTVTSSFTCAGFHTQTNAYTLSGCFPPDKHFQFCSPPSADPAKVDEIKIADDGVKDVEKEEPIE